MNKRLAQGLVLGKYRIEGELGRGGMGVVYSALDTVLGRTVAIKILPLSLVSDDVFVRRFREEAKAIALLSHPNVVHINNFDIIDGMPVIEMEYISGGSLSRKLQHEFVSAAEVVHYAHGIACALSYCHSLNAVHRDVKPSNILIDGLNRARLADFGITKVMIELEHATFEASASGVFRGTPLYAPPEAWDGDDPTPAWDIYGLGAVMFQGLTGALPYEANTPMQLVKKLATTPARSVCEINPAVSSELSTLVKEMLQADPGERLKDAEAVRQRLQGVPEFVQDVNTDAVTRSIVRPTRSSLRRTTQGLRKHGRKGVWAGLGIVSIIAAISLVGFMGSSRHRDAVANVPHADGTQPAPKQQLLDMKTVEATTPAAELLACSKGIGGPGSAIFDAVYQGAIKRAAESWLVCTKDGKPDSIIGFGNAALISISLVPQGENSELTATGHWAEYADNAASVIRFGTVAGTLRWSATPASCIGVLTFTSEQDGVSVEVAVTAALSAKLQTDTQFVAEMENSEYLPSLLYRELLPRYSEWAIGIDSVIPSFADGVFEARHLSDSAQVNIDGKLDDEAWQSAAAGESGAPLVLSGVPRKQDGELRALVTKDALYIGVRCKTAVVTSFELRLLSSFLIPQSACPVYELLHQIGTTESSESFANRDDNSGSAQARFASTKDGDTIQVEGRIPLENFAGSPALARWRVNAVLWNGARAETRIPVCRWGYADETEVRHGAVLRLAAN